MNNSIKNLLTIASAEVGTTSDPATQNNKYNQWHYGGNVNNSKLAWCVVFVRWCLKEAGLISLFCDGVKTAYVPYVQSTAKMQKKWVTSDYQPGDFLIYDWNGDGSGDHIGICSEKVSDGVYKAYEGNTTSGNNKSCVALKTRYAKNILGAYRIDYPEDKEATAVENVSSWAKEAWEYCTKEGLMDGTRPKEAITREEVAVILKRLKEG